jgi:hypothetical protein
MSRVHGGNGFLFNPGHERAFNTLGTGPLDKGHRIKPMTD